MKKILVIEDESALQKTIGDALGQEGYEIVAALDGEIGSRLAQEKIPDLILLDLILPKLNGFDVLKSLKENQATAGIPVIVLTNLEGMGDIQKALDLGATTYLVKSNYSLEDIITKVTATLSNAR
ncbi:MAG: response regulator [Candidatus Wildermuthbacteria bacterium]|nr:response regulator [Candidatus Wildermuthbacteria bacterium]